MGRPKQFDPALAVGQAMDLFWRRGYAGTTPQDLAGELGIGKGSLYHAFGGKRQLFDLAVERYLDQHVEATIATLERPGPARERLRTALRRLVEADADHRGCLMINSAVEFGLPDDAVVRQVRRMFARIEGAFEALLASGQRAGEIRPDLDAGATAGLLLNTVAGLRVLARVESSPDRLLRVVDATVDLL
ncbi:TetR/AcrR family transcriptional regulator [Pseudosporangium ferrugineum]|uniref:TetR family transcriptional regulator n=1 Tax=Pseudosporangium ferrugineum TaxID=439699 RepID=A0A2T0SG15_9ACTN|nr:TetR/AcrR family transcriptional regulator [Pseudosporangium ferrugineum]PRY32364.1 TetR family transcriptional regulator [Pseudosporangium ferrugineum]